MKTSRPDGEVIFPLVTFGYRFGPCPPIPARPRMPCEECYLARPIAEAAQVVQVKVLCDLYQRGADGDPHEAVGINRLESMTADHDGISRCSGCECIGLGRLL